MIGSWLLSIAWVGWIQLAAWGVGRWLVAWLLRPPVLSPGRTSSALRPIFEAALGFIALAEAAFLLAAFHLLHPWLVALLTFLAGLSGLAPLLRRRPWKPARPALSDMPLGFAIVFAFTFLPNALYPVLAQDDIVYHLLLPKLYLQHHGLLRLPWNLYANMPHALEVLYTIPMALGDFTAPKVLALSFTFWNLAALYRFARPLLGRFGAGLIPLLYLSGKGLQWHLGLAYIEPVLGFFLLCACLALLSWRESGSTGHIRLGAACLGFALASKYTAWSFGLGFLAVVAVLLWRRQDGERAGRIRILAQVAAILLAFVAPWLVKNALLVGNPIYPGLYGTMGGAGWSAVQHLHSLRWQSLPGGPDKTVWSFLLLPFRLTTNQPLFLVPCFSIALMALWLAAFFFRSSYRSEPAPLLALSALGFAGWAAGPQQGRFLVSLVPVMAATAALALSTLPARPKGLGAAFAGIVGIGILQAVFQVYPYAPHWEVFSRSREELIKGNRNYSVCTFLNSAVPADGRVLGMWDSRFFFLDRPFDGDPVCEAPTGLARLRAAGDPQSFARELAGQSCTHVVINTGFASKYVNNEFGFDLIDDRLYPASSLEEDKTLLLSFVDDYLEPVARHDSTLVYRIRAEKLSFSPGTMSGSRQP